MRDSHFSLTSGRSLIQQTRLHSLTSTSCWTPGWAHRLLDLHMKLCASVSCHLLCRWLGSTFFLFFVLCQRQCVNTHLYVTHEKVSLCLISGRSLWWVFVNLTVLWHRSRGVFGSNWQHTRGQTRKGAGTGSYFTQNLYSRVVSRSSQMLSPGFHSTRCFHSLAPFWRFFPQ